MANPEPMDDRILTEERFQEITARLVGFARKEGRTDINLISYWNGQLRWARNRASLASDRRGVFLRVARTIRGALGHVVTNQLDDVSLQGAMAAAERLGEQLSTRHALDAPMVVRPDVVSHTMTWSTPTFNRSAEDSATIVRRMTVQAEQQGLLSAGYIEVLGATIGSYSRDEHGRTKQRFGKQTQGECSTTVRNPNGTGSGWAGISGYDVATFDETVLATRAFDKCVSSLNPVRIEPGRYTVILEPQAVAGIVRLLMNAVTFKRDVAEGGDGPFASELDSSVQRIRSKLGLKVMDQRVTISHDPSDPELGVLAVPGLRPVTWIKDGVLTALQYMSEYGIPELYQNEIDLWRNSFRMSGGSATLEEMIASTERGILVTRFSNPVVIDNESLLATGLTRDGLWLIEKGKISKAVRNFRFTESPFFVLNNIEQLGIPTKVFEPGMRPEDLWWGEQRGLGTPIVPALKCKDFSFTSTVDAV